MHTKGVGAEVGRRVLSARLDRVEVRAPNGANATGDGSVTIAGYAAVFDAETVLYDGTYCKVRERIAPGAFSRVLSEAPLVHLNHGHDMLSAIASTHVRGGEGAALPVGGLELSEDAHGLRFFARCDAEDPDVQRLAVKLRAGVVNQASFAFTIGAEDEESSTVDGVEDCLYTIREVKALYDVCACAQGAYPQTEAALRTLYRAAFPGDDATPRAAGGIFTTETTSLPSLGRADASPETGRGNVAGSNSSGGQDNGSATARQREALRRRAARARIMFASED